MPVDYRYLDDGGILIEGSGTLSAEDLIELNREIYETPERIRAIAYQICDLTGIENVDVRVDRIRELAEIDSRAAEINPRMLIAIVGEDDLTYGLARMWEAQVREPALEAAVFRRREDAEQWITARRNERQFRDDAARNGEASPLESAGILPTESTRRG